MNNPDNALPLYIMVVIVGIMLGKGWRKFLDQVASAGKTAQDQTSTGSSATTGGTHG